MTTDKIKNINVLIDYQLEIMTTTYFVYVHIINWQLYSILHCNIIIMHFDNNIIFVVVIITDGQNVIYLTT